MHYLLFIYIILEIKKIISDAEIIACLNSEEVGKLMDDVPPSSSSLNICELSDLRKDDNLQRDPLANLSPQMKEKAVYKTRMSS